MSRRADRQQIANLRSALDELTDRQATANKRLDQVRTELKMGYWQESQWDYLSPRTPRSEAIRSLSDRVGKLEGTVSGIIDYVDADLVMTKTGGTFCNGFAVTPVMYEVRSSLGGKVLATFEDKKTAKEFVRTYNTPEETI